MHNYMPSGSPFLPLPGKIGVLTTLLNAITNQQFLFVMWDLNLIKSQVALIS